MFRIGDYVAHYKEGVCEVVNIGKIDMGSSDKEYYTLKPVYDAAGTVYTPVDNKREQIRQLITKEEAENLIKEMSEIVTIRGKQCIKMRYYTIGAGNGFH